METPHCTHVFVDHDGVRRFAPGSFRRRSRPRHVWYLNRVLKAVVAFCTCLALCNAYLLAYPVVACGRWKLKDATARFLFLADPQMEGLDKVRRQGHVGKLDLAFNDAYARHVLTALVRHRRPSHVVVLGDLFSSQWISDEEFADRAQRYRRIFRGTLPFGGAIPAGALAPLLINITGNHDIGYEADLTEQRVQRWEETFGSTNFEFIMTSEDARVEAMQPPIYGLRHVKMSAVRTAKEGDPANSSGAVHFVVVNSMVLDGRKLQLLKRTCVRRPVNETMSPVSAQ